MHSKMEPSHYNHGLQVLATEPLCLSDSDLCQQSGGIYYPTCWQCIADSRTAVWDFFDILKFYSLKLFFIVKFCYWFGLKTDDGLWTQAHSIFFALPRLFLFCQVCKFLFDSS